MGMVVRSNIMAVNAQRQLGMNNSQVGKALEKLSSGYRINRAGDDASGLAISEHRTCGRRDAYCCFGRKQGRHYGFLRF